MWEDCVDHVEVGGIVLRQGGGGRVEVVEGGGEFIKPKMKVIRRIQMKYIRNKRTQGPNNVFGPVQLASTPLWVLLRCTRRVGALRMLFPFACGTRVVPTCLVCTVYTTKCRVSFSNKKANQKERKCTQGPNDNSCCLGPFCVHTCLIPCVSPLRMPLRLWYASQLFCLQYMWCFISCWCYLQDL